MKDIQKQESLKTLKNILTPNDTIYGLVRKVSSSGLSHFCQLPHRKYFRLSL